jgi:NTP pyrophosphatase (non-canonical NTP hydrolase)
MIEFDDYQEWTRSTAVYTNPVYPRLALAEEVGELLGKLAKWERDVASKDMPAERYAELRGDLLLAIEKEGGDVLWQLARVLDDLGIKLSDAAATNVSKLESRKQRNVINGSGDDR